MRGGSGNSNYEFETSLSRTAVYEDKTGSKTRSGQSAKSYYKLKIIDRDTSRMYVVRIYPDSYTPSNGKLAGKKCLPCYVTSMIYRGKSGGIR